MTKGRNADTRAIVTGGAQGIGFAVAETLVDEGCRALALVGRDAANWLRINDPSVSRRHCLIHKTGSRVRVTDLESRNGTLVNDAPVREQVLEPGDRLTIGAAQFLFMAQEQEEDHNLDADSLLVDEDTSFAIMLEAEAQLGKKGWTVVDASAGGVEEVAAAGQLALWLSGSKALFDEHQPIFKAMGKSILHVGELGNAKLVKNAMAMLAAVQHLSLVEISCWLKKGGLDDATFQTIIKNSQQDSVATRRIMEILVSRKFKPRKSWMPKDVGFGLDMARDMEVPMPFVGLAQQMFAIAQATGQDDYEATGIACNLYDVINGNKTKPS